MKCSFPCSSFIGRAKRTRQCLLGVFMLMKFWTEICVCLSVCSSCDWYLKNDLKIKNYFDNDILKIVFRHIKILFIKKIISIQMQIPADTGVSNNIMNLISFFVVTGRTESVLPPLGGKDHVVRPDILCVHALHGVDSCLVMLFSNCLCNIWIHFCRWICEFVSVLKICLKCVCVCVETCTWNVFVEVCT